MNRRAFYLGSLFILGGLSAGAFAALVPGTPIGAGRVAELIMGAYPNSAAVSVGGIQEALVGSSIRTSLVVHVKGESVALSSLSGADAIFPSSGGVLSSNCHSMLVRDRRPNDRSPSPNEYLQILMTGGASRPAAEKLVEERYMESQIACESAVTATSSDKLPDEEQNCEQTWLVVIKPAFAKFYGASKGEAANRTVPRIQLELHRQTWKAVRPNSCTDIPSTERGVVKEIASALSE